MFSITDLEDKVLRPRTAQMVLLFLSLLLAYELLSGVIAYVHFRSAVKSSKQAAVTQTKPRTQASMQKKLAVQLFGEYIPKTLGDLDVKPSGLNLSLVGILFSSNNKASEAIIAAANGMSRVFSVGEVVPGGAKIKQITPDGVVLEREGELESLSLPKNELTFDPLPKPLEDKD